MNPPGPPVAVRWIAKHAPAFGARDFRLLWTGNFASFMGQWIVTTALTWQMLEMTDSAFYLGLIGLARGIPALPMSLYGGVLADRFPKRSLLLCTQSATLAVTGGLCLVVGMGLLAPWVILAAILSMSVSNALDGAGRQTIATELVPREHIASAVSLNAVAQNLTRMAGPALAGVLLAIAGPAVTLAVAAVGPLVMLTTLVLLQGGRSGHGSSGRYWFVDVGRALEYAAQTPAVAGVLLTVAAATFFGMAYTILIPVFARQVLGLGASEYGLLTSAGAIGSVLASLSLASLGGRFGLGRLVPTGAACLGAGMLLFAANQSFPAALALCLWMGAANYLYLTAGNTALQLGAPPDLRGRVVALHQLSPVALHHLGTMALGSAAAILSPVLAMGMAGALTIVITAGLLLRYPAIASLTPPRSEHAPAPRRV